MMVTLISQFYGVDDQGQYTVLIPYEQLHLQPIGDDLVYTFSSQAQVFMTNSYSTIANPGNKLVIHPDFSHSLTK